MKNHLDFIYKFLTVMQFSIATFAGLLATQASLSYLYITDAIERMPVEQQGQLSIAQLQDLISQSHDFVFGKGMIIAGAYFVVVALCALVQTQKNKLEQSQPA